MKYYKIIIDKSFIGVIHSGQFVYENPTEHKLFYTDESNAQYVRYKGILYHDYWLGEITNNDINFIMASIEEISEQEYNTIQGAIRNNERIIIENVEDDDDEEDISNITSDEEPDTTVEFIRSSKITEMSSICRHTIESGFDIILSDQQTHHFSLDTQDQLNLITLSALADTQEQIPYHADGELCRFYSAAEMKQIIAAATQFKMYHTTYYNALKAYINSLETIEEIAAITYGIELPAAFQSDVLKAIT